jgi:cytochrome P450
MDSSAPGLSRVCAGGATLREPKPSIFGISCREANRDVTLRTGHILPKGTIIWLSMVAVHRSPLNFEDPHRFWPERWQHASGGGGSSSGSGPAAPKATGDKQQEEGAAEDGQDGGAEAAHSSIRGSPTPAGNSAAPARSFMTFSYGSHDCLGQALANVEGKTMLAMLCSRFQFAVAPRMGTPEDVEAAEVNRLTMQPGNGMWLLLTPRGGST